MKISTFTVYINNKHTVPYPIYIHASPGEGGTQLFSGRGVRPGFLKCGAWELIFASERGGGPCELKIPKFLGLVN